MENKEEKAIQILNQLNIEQLVDSSVDEFIYGESLLEITPSGLRCIRFGTEEYNQIINKTNGK